MTRNAPRFPDPGTLQRIFRKPPLPRITLPASGRSINRLEHTITFIRKQALNFFGEKGGFDKNHIRIIRHWRILSGLIMPMANAADQRRLKPVRWISWLGSRKLPSLIPLV
jgi:hypothetical protein